MFEQLGWIGHSPLPSQLPGLDAHPALSYAGALAAWESIGRVLSEQE